jgi:hypothetical protein
MLRFSSADNLPGRAMPLPPIDSQVPAHLETATFAVG